MALSDILSRFRQSDAEYDEEGYEDEGYDTSSSAVTQVRFLRENKSVILNLEKVNSVDSRKRIVDFMAGVCAAIDGRIVRVAECTYSITPSTVEISGDMLDGEEF